VTSKAQNRLCSTLAKQLFLQTIYPNPMRACNGLLLVVLTAEFTIVDSHTLDIHVRTA
jgi:hypothetical protein